MPQFKIFRKNPIKKLSLHELKDMESELKLKSGKLTKDVSNIDAEMQYLFQQSKETKSHLEEINIAGQIKTLGEKKEMKRAAHSELQKELRAVSNMLIIKEHEADLKAAGVWERLEKISPEQLEKQLIQMKLQAEDDQAAVKMVTEITSSILHPSAEQQEEGLEDILAVMQQVKEGKLEPATAREKLSQEIEPK